MIRRSSFAGAAAALLGLSLATSILAADAVPAAIKAAVADPARPDADRQRDANRKPGEVLAFAGVKPGDKVNDLLPGGGYFTRLFSKVVGPSGVVYALVPARPANAPPGGPDMAAGVQKIAADPQFSNVRVSDMNKGAPEKVDVAWTSLNYHDMHNRPDANLAAFNKQVFDSLKPGGTYIVIDHAAAKGSGKRDTSALHRVDPELVKSEVTAAGFVFDGESNVLENKQDSHSASSHDASVRGQTDQFVLKFRKPKA